MPPKIYLCSSVRIDYLSHAKSCAEMLECEIEEIYYLSEADYRKAAGLSGIKRIWLRLQLYVFYPILLVRKVLFAKRESIFIVTTNTFYAPLLTAVFGRLRRAQVVHLLYDLFPDAMIVAGKVRRQSFIARLAGFIQRQTQKRCRGTVYLGEVLQKHCEHFYGEPRVAEVIDVSADASLFSPNIKPSRQPLVFHYGGQIGHMHDADTVIRAIRDCCSDGDLVQRARFSFFVSGAQSRMIRESFAESGVEVIPAVPSTEWRERILDFHVGIVTLKPGGAIVCLPSKAYSMMAGGLAILAICPRWSDLAQMIEENDIGWVISNSPYDEMPAFEDAEYFSKIEEKRRPEEVAKEFHGKVADIIAGLEDLDRKRMNAFRVMREQFGKEELGERWKFFLEQVAEPKVESQG
ncbi:MAG: hypothetical protein AAGJ81_05115 [Verrucomicrobiota bacterium]